ncbi:DinB family protein [Paenibacillus sp. HB172176]|uniref:DinB family protein n=1 Tax=Paenibacillus sp. HB172176 TaxID=2493690 RepID=UPI001F1029AE|nr:DinB family protein [Paenibacillus sp. HB172176]
MKELLFQELTLIARTSLKLIGKLEGENWTYRPQANMRSMEELVHHLVAIPSVDLLILQENGRETVRAMEESVEAEGHSKEALSAVLDKGMNDLRAYMEGLSDEEFLHKETAPFYIDHPTKQAKWLIEIVTHLQHHRAQLFQYVKALGHDVNMFDLY